MRDETDPCDFEDTTPAGVYVGCVVFLVVAILATALRVAQRRLGIRNYTSMWSVFFVFFARSFSAR